MGVPILILGRSGSGKSTSLMNFDESEVAIMNVAGKPLPFRKHLRKADRPSYSQIVAVLKRNAERCYVIDDANYLMAFESFDRARQKGYEKFTEMAVNFKELLDAAAQTDENTTVYILMHVDTDETGYVKPKTIGRMLDNQLCIEGLFPVVLMATRTADGYGFDTQTDGNTPAKSPIGLFEAKRIPNDLCAVDDAIRDYWGMAPRTETKKTNRTNKTKEAQNA